MNFAEYAGLSQEVAFLIEAHRTGPSETKNDILLRIVPRHINESLVTAAKPKLIDFGQGVVLPVGEKLYLYLATPSAHNPTPDGIAEVKVDGLYIDDIRVEASRGSLITPAMHIFQKRNGHVNSQGKLISLSAFRQWHVLRKGQFVPLESLKAPELRRKRTTKAQAVDVDALLAELGIK